MYIVRSPGKWDKHRGALGNFGMRNPRIERLILIRFTNDY
jgi:hypothetical protein